MQTEWVVPEELIEIMDESLAAREAMDACIKMTFFKFQLRNAVFLGKKSRKLARKFWSKFNELYPESTSCKLSFNPNNNIVFKQD